MFLHATSIEAKYVSNGDGKWCISIQTRVYPPNTIVKTLSQDRDIDGRIFEDGRQVLLRGESSLSFEWIVLGVVVCDVEMKGFADVPHNVEFVGKFCKKLSLLPLRCSVDYTVLRAVVCWARIGSCCGSDEESSQCCEELAWFDHIVSRRRDALDIERT